MTPDDVPCPGRRPASLGYVGETGRNLLETDKGQSGTDNSLHDAESALIAGDYGERRRAPEYQFGTETNAPAEE